jgi:molecular chaperone HscC
MLVGIDLGTTNSAVAIWKDGEAQLVPNALGEMLTPSAVSIAKDGTTWVGAAALERYSTHPEETVTSFKRMMGTDKTVEFGRRQRFRAEDFSALVLSALREDVAALTGEQPSDVVITVPAYFNDKQRKATRRAGELAGFNVRRLINEPTAAALAFGLQEKGDREPFLVFDLGGGTFDVSIVEMFEGIVEVRASSGDNRLGGDDFNTVMVKLARPMLEAEELLESVPVDRREALLNVAAERTRRALTTATEAEFRVTIGDEIASTTIDADVFEEAAEPLLKRLRDPVIRALRDCGMASADLSEIVLVGGATRMPVVHKALTRMFGRFPNNTVHPDHAVALGASVQAGLLSKGDGLEEIRITDVAPFTMGIAVTERDRHGHFHDGLFSPIIERNTPVPVSRMHQYGTVQDYQEEVKLQIYQGESRKVVDNVKLGEISVPVPRKRAGEIGLNVRFSYDSSGLLEVDADVEGTGIERSLVIADEEDRQSEKEFKKRREELAKLKFHPRDEAENVALMARAVRCYENFTGHLREQVGHWIVEFEAVLERQDPRDIAAAREQLSRALDQLEANSPL